MSHKYHAQKEQDCTPKILARLNALADMLNLLETELMAIDNNISEIKKVSANVTKLIKTLEDNNFQSRMRDIATVSTAVKLIRNDEDIIYSKEFGGLAKELFRMSKEKRWS